MLQTFVQLDQNLLHLSFEIYYHLLEDLKKTAHSLTVLPIKFAPPVNLDNPPLRSEPLVTP